MKTFVNIILLVFIHNLYSISAEQQCSGGHDNTIGCTPCTKGTYAALINSNTVINDNVKIYMIIEATELQLTIPHMDNITNTTTEDMVTYNAAYLTILKANLTDDKPFRDNMFLTTFTDKKMCQACKTDHFSGATATTCISCGANSSAVGGSSKCYCHAGFKRSTSTGPCKKCTDCTTELKFDVTLAMAQDKFVGSIRNQYTTAVATTIAVPESSVQIGDVRLSIKPTIRRLLSTDTHIIVPTTIHVSTEYVDLAKHLIIDDLTEKLLLVGITSTRVGDPISIVVMFVERKTEFPAWFVIGLACTGFVVLIGSAFMCVRLATRHKKESSYMDANAATFDLDASEGYNTSLLNTDANQVHTTSLQVGDFMQDLHLNHNQPMVGLNGVSVSLPHPRFWM